MRFLIVDSIQNLTMAIFGIPNSFESMSIETNHDHTLTQLKSQLISIRYLFKYQISDALFEYAWNFWKRERERAKDKMNLANIESYTWCVARRSSNDIRKRIFVF